MSNRNQETDERGRAIHRMGGTKRSAGVSLDRRYADLWESDKIHRDRWLGLLGAAMAGAQSDADVERAASLADAGYKQMMLRELGET